MVYYCLNSGKEALLINMICLVILYYHFKFFKGYLPQILLGPFLNTLTHFIPPLHNMN